MTNYYVYAHQRQSDGKCFYIGKGKDKRAWKLTDRNQHWHNVVNKYGFKVVILVNNISEAKALELEKSFIQQIGLKNLVNKTTGGEGFSMSDESKAKLSASLYGRTWKQTNETKAKISASKKGIPNNKLKGKKRSEETKAKIAASRKGKTYKK